MQAAQVFVNLDSLKVLALILAQPGDLKHRLRNPLCARRTKNARLERTAHVNGVGEADEHDLLALALHHVSHPVQLVGDSLVVALERVEG